MRGIWWLACVAVLTAGCSSGETSGAQSSTGGSTPTEPVGPSSTVPTTVAAATTTELVPIPLAPGDPWIAYLAPVEDGKGGVGIRLVRPDGSDDHWAIPQVPISKGGQQAHPDWSPDGSLLAFAVDDATDDSKPPELLTRDLWISQPDGTEAERVLDCVLPCVEVDYPAWSPDGSKIAFKEFVENDGVPDFSIRLMDVQTRVVTTLVTAAGTDRLREPRWSPDGQRIALELSHWTAAGELAETAIAVVDLRDPVPTPRVITDWSLWATYPDWHPTEDLIVFSTRPWAQLENGPSNLFTVRPDGSDITQLTEFGAGETRAVLPTWTPDGAQIIFTAVEGSGFGDPTMAIIQRDGSGLQSATSSGPMFGITPRLRPGA